MINDVWFDSNMLSVNFVVEIQVEALSEITQL